MKLIQVVCDQPYFVWQLYVQMLNFREHKVEDKAIVLVAISIGKKPSADMERFRKWTKAEVLYYFDTRKSQTYLSSIRPNLFKQYFAEHSLNKFFYHDQDIIFLKSPDWEALEQGDVCYVSKAAQGYTDYSNYLQKFRPYIFHIMCDIVGIHPDMVKLGDSGCGGAQYVIKGIEKSMEFGGEHLYFWEKVERDCESLNQFLKHAITNGIRRWKPNEFIPTYNICAWMADMWAVLWNLWLWKKTTQHHEHIDFCWFFEKTQHAKHIYHNAGVDDNNEYRLYYKVLAGGRLLKSNIEEHEANDLVRLVKGTMEIEENRRMFFRKDRFAGHFPFAEDLSFVPKDLVQSEYIKYFKAFSTLQSNNDRKMKVLGILNTTNQINQKLLSTVIAHIKTAADHTDEADVEVVTCSWQPIPDNPFKSYITPFNNLGHLNYILQLKQVLAKEAADIIVILEHDVIYPKNYFSTIINEWDGSKYGIICENYIGMNNTGYVEVKERHQPFSVMSMAKFYLEGILTQKVDECIKNMDNGNYPKGWCCIEPDNKSHFKVLPFTNINPAIHVNMNNTGEWGTGREGKNHHFTSHCLVCYEADSKGQMDRQDWGNYRKLYPFDS